jgi:hypothetical protein
MTSEIDTSVIRAWLEAALLVHKRPKELVDQCGLLYDGVSRDAIRH